MSIDIDTRRPQVVRSRRSGGDPQAALFFLVIMLCCLQAITLGLVLTWEVRYHKALDALDGFQQGLVVEQRDYGAEFEVEQRRLKAEQAEVFKAIQECFDEL